MRKRTWVRGDINEKTGREEDDDEEEEEEKEEEEEEAKPVAIVGMA